MRGLMQDWPLTCNRILDYASINYQTQGVITEMVEGGVHHITWPDLRRRALTLSKRFKRHGIGKGDRIATLAWNTWRHLELWYGILGAGGIYHTVNPRLFPDQIIWIINDAEDRLLFVDLTFIPIIEALADKLPSLEAIVVLTDRAHMPESRLQGLVCYEDWLAEADDDFDWVEVDENDAAGLCYTSGTTGNPKGVLYSHRGNVLHSMMANMPNMMGIELTDIVMPVVPLFHANGWGLGFTGPMMGVNMVMPGARMDGASMHHILNTHKVSFTAAVPTIWLMLLQHLEQTDGDLPYLKRVVIGGAACPPAMIETFKERYDVDVVHAWGMTEMSPLGSMCTIKPAIADRSRDELMPTLVKQGHAPFGVDMKIVDDDGKDLPRDGATFGRLVVRGPAVAKSYFKGAGGDILDEDGYFDTGDVATIDEHGYMQITDRSKDVIKSGGEWISSIEIENLAVGHPDVAEAAVIGVSHPKWDERPLLIIVPGENRTPDKQELLDFLDGKIARWWMPNDVVYVDEIPHTATGKIQKTALRDQFSDYTLPDGN